MSIRKIILTLIILSPFTGMCAENIEANRKIQALLDGQGVNAAFIAFKGSSENNETLLVQSSKAAEKLIFTLLLQKPNFEKMLSARSPDLNTSILIDSCELNNGFQNKILFDAACESGIKRFRIEAQITLTPLQATCLTGDLTGMKMLIKAGAHVNNAAETLSPLESCLTTKKYNQVDFLIVQGANVNRKNKRLFASPLMILSLASASASDHAAASIIAKAMIDKGADPHYRAKDGFSELHAAAGAGNLAIVKLLVELGVDINAKTDEGLSPLGRAEKNNNAAVVDFLLSKGAQR
jgi:ankyrin repeat protein